MNQHVSGFNDNLDIFFMDGGPLYFFFHFTDPTNCLLGSVIGAACCACTPNSLFVLSRKIPTMFEPGSRLSKQSKH